MRILAWSEAEAYGGHERMAVALLRGLAEEHGADVRWRMHPANERLHAALPPSMPAALLPRPSLPDRFWRGRIGMLRGACRAAVAAENPDVVLALPGWPTSGCTPEFSGLSTPLAVYVPYGPRGKGLRAAAKRWAAGHVLNRADLVITCAGGEAEHLRHSTRTPVAVVDNFVDEPASITASSRSRPAIGLVGRINPLVKGHLLLVAALAANPDLAASADWLVVGAGGDEDGLRRTIAATGLEERIRCCGWLAPDEAYARLDAVVMPSYLEAAPLVAIEACVRGLPVIGSALPELEGYVLPGLSFPVGDARGLATAVRCWLACRSNPDFCDKLARLAATVRARHDRRRAIAEFHHLLAGLAGTSACTSSG